MDRYCFPGLSSMCMMHTLHVASKSVLQVTGKDGEALCKDPKVKRSNLFFACFFQIKRKLPKKHRSKDPMCFGFNGLWFCSFRSVRCLVNLSCAVIWFWEVCIFTKDLLCFMIFIYFYAHSLDWRTCGGDGSTKDCPRFCRKGATDTDFVRFVRLITLWEVIRKNEVKKAKGVNIEVFSL